MYRKVMVLEIKDLYCIAMTDDGAVIRIRKKNEMHIGDRIYVLPEDLYEEQQAVCVKPKATELPKPVSHYFSNKMLQRGCAAAAVLLIFALIVANPRTAMQAYASCLSFDAERSLQLELDQDNRILRAVSHDNTFTPEELKQYEGKHLSEVESALRDAFQDSPSLIIGYASKDEAKDEAKDDSPWQYAKRIFAGKQYEYYEGSAADIEKADEEKVSIGKYVSEQKTPKEVQGESVSASQGEGNRQEQMGGSGKAETSRDGEADWDRDSDGENDWDGDDKDTEDKDTEDKDTDDGDDDREKAPGDGNGESEEGDDADEEAKPAVSDRNEPEDTDDPEQTENQQEDANIGQTGVRDELGQSQEADTETQDDGEEDEADEEDENSTREAPDPGVPDSTDSMDGADSTGSADGTDSTDSEDGSETDGQEGGVDSENTDDTDSSGDPDDSDHSGDSGDPGDGMDSEDGTDSEKTLMQSIGRRNA